MARKAIVLLTLAALVAVPAAAQEGQSVDGAFREAGQEFGKAETPEARMAIVRGFLERFPESKYTEQVLGVGVQILSNDLDDAEGALELAESLLAKVEDPDIRFGVQKVLLGIHGNLGHVKSMYALIEEMSAGREMKYRDHLSVAGAAAKAEVWDLALEHSEAALALATPETVKAGLRPGQNMPEERIQTIVKRMKGDALITRGWALANFGRTEEGIASFEEAKGYTTYSYIGVPEGNINLFWAKALMLQGDVEGAIEKIAPHAIMLGRKESLTVLREAYAKQSGSDDGFDDFVWNKRVELAKAVDDFALPDYEGNTHKFSELRGKVTLLAFWFPT